MVKTHVSHEVVLSDPLFCRSLFMGNIVIVIEQKLERLLVHFFFLTFPLPLLLFLILSFFPSVSLKFQNALFSAFKLLLIVKYNQQWCLLIDSTYKKEKSY